MTTKLAKHTPGPWEVRSFDEIPGRFVIVGSNGQGLAHTVGLHHGIDEANARLIAAAPEMLEALKSVALTFAQPKQDLRAEKNSIQHSYAMVCAAIRAGVGAQEENTR